MRLGQLARKYGISKKEVISYLKDQDPSLHSLGHNTKLDEQSVALIASHFADPEKMFIDQQEQQVDEQQEQEQQLPRDTAEPVVSAPESLDQATADPEDVVAPENRETPAKKEEVAIETDKLLEMLESEEEPVDLSKITLIKAPKKELEGLKVVGKIELPEPKKKLTKEEKEAKSEDRRKQREPRLSEEEREKRRLKAKKKKEAYQARQERRRKEKEKQRKKALSKVRYQQKVQQAKAIKQKQKPVAPRPEPAAQVEQVPSPPKTALGKLWRWLTTY